MFTGLPGAEDWSEPSSTVWAAPLGYSGTLDKKARRPEHSALRLSPSPTSQIPTPVVVRHQPASPGSPGSLGIGGHTWSPVAPGARAAAGPAPRCPHPSPAASSKDAGRSGWAEMPPDGRDHKATQSAASRSAEALCSRGNPSRDHKALATSHTCPCPQSRPQLAYSRTYPRLWISRPVAGREEMGGTQPRPRP